MDHCYLNILPYVLHYRWKCYKCNGYEKNEKKGLYSR
jgi:hypothetical protein